MFDVADEVVGSIAEQAELEPSCNFDNCHALSNPCLATPSLRQTSCSSDQILTRKQCQATGLRQMNRERRNRHEGKQDGRLCAFGLVIAAKTWFTRSVKGS
ncbi:hypothetical protein BS47DRAFT_1337725 [Hydnum rufescens UP504]|uniref:Uncharacterized protein n=1 Tax=Hydnum rufescens UP504 TaxID=1448309 RepID=A0A9P6DPL8_9AGAM|nr:hypothetical protein BS47DRAFT_1348314 [Hydnum rufescens UP504]KAF9518865.1 hypothetical protein BS47DRAFT_1337725 [Hydnum rufescens UP504]